MANPKAKATAKPSAKKGGIKIPKIPKPRKPGFLSNIKVPKFLRWIKWPRFMRAIGGYFKGAWEELRQVRWPNRRATWTLTLAVVLFTAFWMLVILGLDMIFQLFLNRLLLS